MSNKNIDLLYLNHLLESIEFHKENTLRQKGSSDIEPPNYDDDVDRWFKQLQRFVTLKPPIYYVDAINVYENAAKTIERIEYDYYSSADYKQKIEKTTINLVK